MACDIRLASEKARFGQPEVGLGITPGFGGTQRLPRIVGVSKAMELILTAKTIKADEAKAIGLVSEVYPAEELMDKAMELANASCANRRVRIQALHPHGHADRHPHRLRFRGRGLRRYLRHRGQERGHGRVPGEAG